MDRKLIIIAILAFLIEATYLAFDLEWLHWPSSRLASENRNEHPLGEIEYVHSDVRRRGFESAFWEDSSSRDHLFANDSILTLKGSAAQLKLAGDVHLNLHENTLIVIEPLSESEDQTFRLHFEKGDLRSHTANRNVALKSGEWVITAQSGSDISLRSVEGQNLELEVQSGSAQVFNRQSSAQKTVSRRERLTMSQNEIVDFAKLAADLVWTDPRPQRIYAHRFPAEIPLRWQGEATALSILRPTAGIENVPLASSTIEKSILLTQGTHQLTLRNGKKISSSLTVEVLKAPEIIHLLPLPRDRVRMNEDVLFAWMSEPGFSRFEVRISSDPQFHSIVQSEMAERAQIQFKLNQSGDFHWQVIGFDEANFLIPADYSYPLFVQPDPFAPPVIRTPSANPEDPNDESRNDCPLFPGFLAAVNCWKPWQSWILPVANAASREVKSAPNPPVIFNWEPVNGADHYVIEISSQKDFRSPEVIAKSSRHFYAWQSYNKQIYYYRVAAGSSDGRLGYFSEPQPIDLSVWPPKGVKIGLKDRPAPNPRPTEVPRQIEAPKPPSELPRTTPEIVSLTPAPAPTSNSSQEKISGSQIPDEPASASWQIWWQPLYSVQSRSVHDGGRAQFRGFSLFSVGAALELKAPSTSPRIEFELQKLDWKPTPAESYPYQSTISEWPARLNADWSSTRLPRWRLSLGQTYRLIREDFEAVSSQSRMWIGTGPIWQGPNGIQGHFGIRAGSSILGGEIQLQSNEIIGLNNFYNYAVRFESNWLDGKQDWQLQLCISIGLERPIQASGAKPSATSQQQIDPAGNSKEK